MNDRKKVKPTIINRHQKKQIKLTRKKKLQRICEQNLYKGFPKLAKGKLRIVPQAVVNIMKRDIEAQVVIHCLPVGRVREGFSAARS